MNLYATVTSERATKGQGGNDFIKVELKVMDRSLVHGTLWLHKDGEIELLNGSGVCVYKANAVIFTETKGNKKKGETRCKHGVILNYDDCLNCDKGQ